MLKDLEDGIRFAIIINHKLINRLDDTTFNIQQDGDAKKRKMTFATKVPLTTLQSHRDAIMDVSWYPLNKDQAVTASWDNSIILWDVELGGMVASMSSNKAHSRLSINPISGLVLTASMDSVIRLWDFTSKGLCELHYYQAFFRRFNG